MQPDYCKCTAPASVAAFIRAIYIYAYRNTSFLLHVSPCVYITRFPMVFLEETFYSTRRLYLSTGSIIPKYYIVAYSPFLEVSKNNIK